MLELLIVRHGQTDWNMEHRVMGDKPIPINTIGKAQARSLAKGLKDIQIDAVYTSPVTRAIQTSQPILKGRDSISLYEEPGFAEIGYGDWVGRAFSEIPELPVYFKNPTSVPIPNGENLGEVQKRALTAIENIRAKHADQRILAISHADVIKLILIHYLGLPMDEMQKFRIDNGSLTILHFDDIKDPRIICVNAIEDLQRYCHVRK